MSKLRDLFCLYIPLLLVISSCAPFSDDKITQSDTYNIEEKSKCKLEPARLSRILEEDIKSQLICLETSLNLFVDSVKIPNTKQIGKKDLEKFVNTFFSKNSKHTNKIINFVLDINYLLFGEEKGAISLVNINNKKVINPRLIEIAIKINKHGPKLKKAFLLVKDKKERYWNYRKHLKISIDTFSSEILKYISPTQNVRSLDIIDFIKKHKFILKGYDLNLNLFSKMLFLKQLFIGGNNDVLKTNEARTLIKKLSKIGLLYFDFLFIESNPLVVKKNGNNDRINLKLINRVIDLIEISVSHKIILTHSDLMYIGEELYTGDIKFHRLDNIIKIIKNNLINNKEYILDDYSYRNVLTILNFGKQHFEQNYFNKITYNQLARELNKNNVISSLKQPFAITETNLNCRILGIESCIKSKYDIISPIRLKTLWEMFMITTTQYKYFKDDKKNQYISYDSKRTSTGFNHLSNTRTLMSYLFWIYACPDRKEYYFNHKCGLNAEMLNTFLNDFKPVFEMIKIWPPNKKIFSDNTILLSDLFQFQSDGNGTIDIHEITEYSNIAFTAISLGDKVLKRLEKYCPNISDNTELNYTTNCFRSNYFNILFEDLKQSKYLPQFKRYKDRSSKNDLRQFLRSLEIFARDDSSPNIPISTRDIMLITGALLNIESTMLRYDINQNNRLDYKELSNAFKTYSTPIMSIANIEDKDFAKSTFLYMINNQVLPTSAWDQTKLIYFHYFGDHEEVKAYRSNIASIMSFIKIMARKKAALKKAENIFAKDNKNLSLITLHEEIVERCLNVADEYEQCILDSIKLTQKNIKDKYSKLQFNLYSF